MLPFDVLLSLFMSQIFSFLRDFSFFLEISKKKLALRRRRATDRQFQKWRLKLFIDKVPFYGIDLPELPV